MSYQWVSVKLRKGRRCNSISILADHAGQNQIEILSTARNDWPNNKKIDASLQTAKNENCYFYISYSKEIEHGFGKRIDLVVLFITHVCYDFGNRIEKTKLNKV